jgi:hypothetical protein
MGLSRAERETIGVAGTSSDQSVRGRAVATVLGTQGDDRQAARRLLAESYLRATAPSFHLIPRGDAMLPADRFERAYAVLAEGTDSFRDVSVDALVSVIESQPSALAPLRMICGLTLKELGVTARLATGTALSEAALRTLERETIPPAAGSTRAARRSDRIHAIAETVIAVLERRVLAVPQSAEEAFHSKLDKPDTLAAWTSVAQHAVEGVPYSELLYQRYVGGVWRQAQDAYSEVKGDAILELPLERLLIAEGVPHWRSRSGATGARETAQRYGIEPGPDFLVPAESPAVIIETKVVEDGGSARDKAARIQRLSEIASQRGLVICAVVDGKGWAERPNALADVIIATQGRTFSLSTLPSLLDVPEIRIWRGRAA